MADAPEFGTEKHEKNWDIVSFQPEDLRSVNKVLEHLESIGVNSKLINNKVVSKEIASIISANCPNLIDSIRANNLKIDEKVGRNELKLDYIDVLRYNNSENPNCASLDFKVNKDGNFSRTCINLRRDLQAESPESYFNLGAHYSNTNTINKHGDVPILCNIGEKTVTDFYAESNGATSIATRKMSRTERQLQERSYMSGGDLMKVCEEYQEEFVSYDKDGLLIMSGSVKSKTQNSTGITERDGIFGGREERGTPWANKNFNAYNQVKLQDFTKEIGYYPPKKAVDFEIGNVNFMGISGIYYNPQDPNRKDAISPAKPGDFLRGVREDMLKRSTHKVAKPGIINFFSKF